ncbi:uncharacterized PE-PGRS family protein PE_PGRS10-like [Pseudophryne corroboree]|uniref:uncharacterized PE-PGRS family protein PE_PGRS10-like n=1 Tax=Pseudophryne corroboree TaxID=495146 RepID=UPI003081DFE6
MITLTLLVIAAGCCFAPATSVCIRNGEEQESSCLEKALANKGLTVGDLANFICTYYKFKDATDKTELIKEIQHIEVASGCTRKDIFGSDANLETLVMDGDGALQNLTTTVHQMLNYLCPVRITPTVCHLLFLQRISQGHLPNSPSTHTTEGGAHNRHTRDLLGPVGGLLSLLSILGPLGSVLGPVGNLLGPVGNLLGGVTGAVSGLGVTDLLGGKGGLLGSGCQSGNGGLLSGVGGLLGSGGSGGALGGLLSGNGGLLSGVGGLLGSGGSGGGLGGLLSGNGGLLSGVGGLLGSGGGLGGLVGTVSDLTGGLTGGKGQGLLGSLPVSGLLSGLLGGLGGIAG